jgi:hypothetical protein
MASLPLTITLPEGRTLTHSRVANRLLPPPRSRTRARARARTHARTHARMHAHTHHHHHPVCWLWQGRVGATATCHRQRVYHRADRGPQGRSGGRGGQRPDGIGPTRGSEGGRLPATSGFGVGGQHLTHTPKANTTRPQLQLPWFRFRPVAKIEHLPHH